MTEASIPVPAESEEGFRIPSGYSVPSDVIDTTLWPELPQVDNDDLDGRVFGILDVRKLTYNTQTGTFFVCKCENLEGPERTQFTCAMGGKVIPEKLQAFLEKNAFPVAVRMVKIYSGQYASRGYFDLMDPGAPLPQKAQRSASGTPAPVARKR